MQTHRPDGMVLDWMMPGLDGIGVMKHLRTANDKTLVLMLTARDVGQKLAHEPIALKPLLEDAARQIKTLAPERQVTYLPFDDVRVRGDRDALKQVLLILLDNAIVHTAADAKVSIATARRNSQIEIRVRDNGDGIPPEAQKHIFERFYRGDASRPGRSTGLGLAIAQELVRAQNGTLQVKSAIGKGSEFHVPAETSWSLLNAACHSEQHTASHSVSRDSLRARTMTFSSVGGALWRHRKLLACKSNLCSRQTGCRWFCESAIFIRRMFRTLRG